jgi:NitT/TauT family transport system permease protein
MIWVIVALAFWAAAWALNVRLANRPTGGGLLVPAIFGMTILVVWEGFVRGLGISPVILPPPSAIAVRFASALPTLWADFNQGRAAGLCPWLRGGGGGGDCD